MLNTMVTALHNLPFLPPISASKNKNLFKIRLKSPFKKTKRKSKPIALPRLTPTLRRAIFSFASSAFLPPPLNLLINGGGDSNGGGGAPPGGGSGGDWWFGKRRGPKWDLDDILRLILSLSAGSLLGLGAKEARVFGLGISGLKNGALCFLLGFVVCFFICEGFVFGRKKRRNWCTNWRMQ